MFDRSPVPVNRPGRAGTVSGIFDDTMDHTSDAREDSDAGRGNRQVVSDAYDALARGDDDSFLGHLADRVGWVIPGPPGRPVTGTHTGKEALLAAFARFSEVAELQELVIERVVGDGDLVIVLGRERWRVRASGRSFETIWANAVTVEDGKITRVVVYADTSNETEAYAGR